MSRRQLPQYIAPAPPVKDRILTRRRRQLTSAAAETTPRVEVLEQVAFVRLIPADLVRLDGAEVQPIDERRSEQAIDERGRASAP